MPPKPARKPAARKATRPRAVRPRAAKVRARRDRSISPDRFDELVVARELFWNNVIREILTALSTISSMDAVASDEPSPAPETKAVEEPGHAGDESAATLDPLDGRLAVVTVSGERIPIAQVYPLFACGIPGTEAERALSVAVECTVFQIRTPAGEVYTLPLHEIRGFHAMTEDLMSQLESAAGTSGTGEPFGFAAFTSLSRSSGAAPAAGLPNDIAD